MTFAEADPWIVVTTCALLASSLWLTLPSGTRPSRRRRILAGLTGFAGLALMWANVPRMTSISAQAAFTLFAVYTVFSAAAAITSRSPVYCAIWFAASLLGVGALMLLQGAQFVGVATVAVYAGAIVVTFLFVLMLAQPGGHSYYDRISWGPTPPFVATVVAVLFLAIASTAVLDVDREVVEAQALRLKQLNEAVAQHASSATVRAVRIEQHGHDRVAHLEVAVRDPEQRASLREPHVGLLAALRQTAAESYPDFDVQRVVISLNDVGSRYHTANLGGQLFGRHLIAVQASGALLLAALVGAVAIAARGGDLERKRGLE